MKRSKLSMVLTGGALVLALVGFTTPQATASTSVSATKTTAKALLAKIPVAPEAGASSYVRSKFPYPIDADKDCQNTRAEVLISESLAPVSYTTSKHCYVSTGKWYSYYDGLTFTKASQIQIDHLVPLEQAWVSGASAWSAKDRQNYANDLAFAPGLVGVSVHMNEQKGAQDPAHWLPPRAAALCTYAIQWVEIKYRWRLSMDVAERNALAKILSGACGAKTIVVPPRGR